jgi:hypothetical protein
MGEFIGGYEIDAVWLGDGQWRLDQDFSYKRDNGEVITAKKGFVFDFASVPRIFWGIISPTGPLAPASVIHDWLYEHKEIEGRAIERPEADDIFLYAMIDSGVGWFKRNLAYSAVLFGGGHAWDT